VLCALEWRHTRLLENVYLVLSQGSFILAQTAPAQGDRSPLGFLIQMGPILLIFAVIYFLFIMPQQRRERQLNAMRAGLSKGDEVITAGGIFGTVVGLGDDDVVLRVDEDVTIRFARESIERVVAEPEAEAAEAAGKKKK